MKSLSIGLLALVLLVSCNKSSKKATADAPSSGDVLRDYASQKLGEDYKVIFNKSNEFAAISAEHKIKPSDPLPTIKFEVVQITPFESIFADVVPGGSLKWADEYILEVTSKVGAPPQQDEVGGPKTYQYHAKNRKKFSGPFFKRE